MKIAITGGTGFVGGHLARLLAREGHHCVVIARGVDHRDPTLRDLPNTTFRAAGIDDEDQLAAAFDGCDAVAHCAGINLERGAQTYERVHVRGTQAVVQAAQRAGARKVAPVSFLRARPACGSGYHESKFAAEEIVRASGLDYTVFKPGVIYGRGDHMLDHLSHAFHTFPVFAFVGFQPKPVRPLAVEDFVQILRASLIEDRMSRQTVAVTGPEQMDLTEAVRRVARVVGRRPLMFPLPLWFHYAFGWFCERTMRIPLVSHAQVRILSEGVIEPSAPCDPLPEDLQPRRAFTGAQIRAGLPEPAAFGLADCRCWSTAFHRA